jgi:GntR family transcriptional regulator
VVQRYSLENRSGRRSRRRLSSVQWVCDLLRTELINGAYADSPLPSEDALIRKYGVTRGTIREVLANLGEQGAIERVRGAGTFVLVPSALHHDLAISQDLAQDVNSHGTRVVIRTTYASIHAATDFIADRLELALGADVVILESVTTLDGFPLSIRSAFMPADLFGRPVTEGTINLHRSPYEVMEDMLNEPVGDTELQISCSNADPITAASLNVDTGAALLNTTRVVRALDGRAIEYSISHARGDKLVFSTIMRTQGRRTTVRF